jgi:predicted secreted protein
MAVNGNTIIVTVGGAEVASQRGATFDSSADMLDISDKTTNNAKFIAGKKTDTVTCNALYTEADVPQEALRTAYAAGTSVSLIWHEASTDGTDDTGGPLRTAATAFISSLSVNAPEHGPAELDATFQVSGGWVDA